MQIFYNFHHKVERVFGSIFDKYGRFIARHPWKIIFIASFINIGLGFGLLNIKFESGIEQYTPTDSTASKNRDQVRNMFTIDTTVNFYEQSLPDFGYYGSVIIERKDGGNMLDSSLWGELTDIYMYVNSTLIYDENDSPFTFSDICAKRFGVCIVEGDVVFTSTFLSDMIAGTITYPRYTCNGEEIYINRILGGVQTMNQNITSATAIKLRFNLESERTSLSRKWELAFIDKIATYSKNTLTVKYAFSDSLAVEISNSLFGGLKYSPITVFLMILFSSLVLMGGNSVTNRYNLGFAGVLGTGLAILGSAGLVTASGATFVDIAVGMPFLILGIGVDDMFILLSGLAGTNSDDDVETRIGQTMRTSGIAITITSITDVIAFAAGAASVFPSVRNFSWYTGCAILFCYLNYISFYIGCMTINEKRVSKNLHFCGCFPVKSKAEEEKVGASKCVIFCCSGSPHKNRNEIEGPVEKYLKKFLKTIVLFKPTQALIVFLFLTYVGFSVWGVTEFKEGLDIRDVVGEESYYYYFFDTDQRKFSQSFTVSLNFNGGINYLSNSTITQIESLVGNVKSDSQVSDEILISWIHAYRLSSVYDDSSDAAFIAGLQSFLSTTTGNFYINDVMIDDITNSVIASRIHVLTASLTQSTEQTDFMIRIRNIVESSSLSVFAYAPAFIFLEQYVAIIPQTLQTLCICVGAVFIATSIFMSLPFYIFLVTLTVVTIMVGVVGFIHFWGLTLSAITMIHIIMCVGFCIDLSTHICHGYITAVGNSRSVRVSSAIDSAGGPIVFGAISTILGVIVTAFLPAYIFSSFFKIIFLVMLFGLAHADCLLPVILAYIGPLPNNDVKSENYVSNDNKRASSIWIPEPDYPGAENYSRNNPAYYP